MVGKKGNIQVTHNRMMHHSDHNLDECRLNLPDLAYLNASAISLTLQCFTLMKLESKQTKNQTGAFLRYAICYTTY